jgi:hypothetical protein
MPVEAPVAVGTSVGTMEITVSKSELLRELTATQGVVERKTTIPILSIYSRPLRANFRSPPPTLISACAPPATPK